ncbi:carboxypeptidase-like regulatory domain-containing protein [Hymenobacter sp. DH14]|uniref:Carboxypeptidase-like regulatory domain-containing protein n=1 Tax=Hymenobacter cyanobacteriorum TaxID=2926463 RepID=A0A9X1VIU8_9BACT|nr:carboxypeptidase-like regulatory domain-containing protein [Hymenobacter cyanobacteriorum]MCI1189077.1 carboxypeptidase-like regulatory domain-containing protein [Hymenobacter cyanobacteriorum]
MAFPDFAASLPTLRRLALLPLLLLLGSVGARAQISISGQVRDSLTQAPLPFASVFLANTTRGTTTDAEGRFRLTNVAPGHYDLGVSYVGYRLFNQSVNLTGPLVINPLVAPLAQQLAEIVVRPEPNREDDYQRFRELFLGNSTLSRQCRILNPDGVRVRYDPQQNVLTATVPHALEVENPALGYRLTFYQLDFRAEFADQSVGLTLLTQVVFKDLPGTARQQKRWAANRQKAYLGSYQHFLRSMYANRVAEEGFRVQKLRRVPNPRRLAADAVLRQLQRQHSTAQLPDSLLQALREPRELAFLYKPTLPPDSLRRTEPGTDRVWLRFRDLLAVTYERETPDANYRRPGPNFTSVRPRYEESVVHLQQPEAEVEAIGALVVPLAVLNEDYWGFEKIGELLPLDYQLPAGAVSTTAKPAP